VFGRYVNGVPLKDVCSTSAKVAEITGEFIHAEQKWEIQQPDLEEGWVQALLDTFGKPQD
jgi:hypothetical protein